jgi:lysophosphatidate acyltransferase
MIFSGPFIVRALRWAPPAAVIMGSTTTYMTVMALLQCASLVLPRAAASRLEMILYSSYQRMVGFWFETWSCVEFCFYGDRLPEQPENVLYISNHQCTMDWVLVEQLCIKQGNSGGRTRYILKDAIKYVPLYGWILGERGGIFVKRRRGTDQERFIRGLSHLAETNKPTWLVLFPEGTRYNPCNQAEIERSQEYARSLGVREMRHVLTPKTTGFELALDSIRNHFSAVYDVTIYYEGYYHGNDPVHSPSPDMFRFFTGKCRRVHVHIKRTPISEIPHNSEEQKMWLYNAFCEKDRLLDEVVTRGTYSSAVRQSLPLPLQSTLLPTLLYSGVLIGALSHRYGRWWWIGSFVGFSLIGFVRMSLKS